MSVRKLLFRLYCMLTLIVGNIQHHAFFLITYGTMFSLYSHQEEISPLKEGNFVVRTAGSPSPLFANGQNILDKHNVILYNLPSYVKGHAENVFVWQNEIMYGITNKLSVLLAPTYIHATIVANNQKIISKGFADLPLQFEYSCFNKQTTRSSLQGTVLGSLLFPTGTSSHQTLSAGSGHIPTGFGALSYMLGGTLSYVTTDWYSFFDVIGWLTTKNKDGLKPGQTLFYDWGISHNLKHFKKWIMLLGLECNGFFTSHDKLFGTKDPNSGGNHIYFGPTLFISSNYLTFQAGIQAPINQHIFGIQDISKWRCLLNGGFIF